MEQLFIYNNTNITFRKENGTLMVNATEMAKPFGKSPKDWLRTQQATELINSLSAVRQISLTDLVLISQGGSIQGTWLHEDVALLFAQWLSVDFYLWCNDRIKELLTTGVATVSNDDEAILHAIQVLQKRVEESRQKLELAEHKIELQAPKVLFADAVATSDRSVLVSELAKILKQNGVEIGQNRLFAWMREKGYLCCKGEYYNQPAQKAMELGLFELKKTSIAKPDGSVMVTCTTKVTGKGQIYFVNKFITGETAKTAEPHMCLTD